MIALPSFHRSNYIKSLILIQLITQALLIHGSENNPATLKKWRAIAVQQKAHVNQPLIAYIEGLEKEKANYVQQIDENKKAGLAHKNIVLATQVRDLQRQIIEEKKLLEQNSRTK